jgi:hypothetical protein
MIDQRPNTIVKQAQLVRDERSMRVFEYALAAITLVSALLLSLR